MAKEDLINMEGHITEILPNRQFRIKLSNDHLVLCTIGGILKKKLRFRTSLVEGDHVKIEMSTYDLTRGRIIDRITK